jgi:DNA-binding SARP family transcriptional activator/predicted negative regulator of RcsB-dependent stress response
MRFQLLGPLEVVHDGKPLPIRAVKQRVVLAALLVDSNRSVPLDVLVSRVWDGSPPSRTALHNLVMRLRHALGADVIRTSSDGYLVHVSDDDLDLRRFDVLVRQAKVEDSPERVSALLGEALALWRGDPLADVPSEALQREVVPGLVERRLTAVEQRVEADLELGRHHDLIAELRELTDHHPLREHFWHQRMRALHRSGRRAEALDCYRQVAKVLADELGLDPGAPLRELHQRILEGDSTRTATLPVPRQLPTRTPHFVGRDQELGRLGDFLGLAGKTVVITALNGTAGIGKTTLAVHWAHQNTDQFPDGQLYVNLRGFDPAGEPMHPAVAIRGFLDALAVPPDRIPTSLDAQAALYRSLLAERRVLVVLDNARDADQVRPLLPASPTCLVLITSRNQLTGLVAREGARPLPLDLLSRTEAVELLVRHLGRDRVDAEPEAVDELVEYCARLPLAVALMAARAAVDPRLCLRVLADHLRDEQTRLDTLDADDPANGIRAVFSYSYQQVSPAAARLFRLLSAHPGPDISVAATASLADLPVAAVERVLDELTTARMLTRSAADRFTMHDLLRSYAGEQEDEERRAAVHRVLDHYLHTVFAACEQLYPHRVMTALGSPVPGAAPEHLANQDEALTWCESEYHVLLGIVDLAAETGFDEHAHRIPWAFASYLNHFGLHRDWVRTQQVAIGATERLGDDGSRAEAHIFIGQAHGRQGDFERAFDHLTTALEIYRRLDNPVGQASAHGSLAWASSFLRRYEDSLAHSLRSAEFYQLTGRSVGECRALNAAAVAVSDLGDHERGLDYALQALRVAETSEDLYSEAILRDTIGMVHNRLGNHAQAVDWLDRAVEVSVEHCSRDDQVMIFNTMGDALRGVGDIAGARRSWERALRIGENLPNPDIELLQAKLRGS